MAIIFLTENRKPKTVPTPPSRPGPAASVSGRRRGPRGPQPPPPPGGTPGPAGPGSNGSLTVSMTQMEVITTPTTCTSSTCSCLRMSSRWWQRPVPGLFHPVKVAGRRGQLWDDSAPQLPLTAYAGKWRNSRSSGRGRRRQKSTTPACALNSAIFWATKGMISRAWATHIQGEAPGVQKIIEHVRHDQRHLANGRLLRSPTPWSYGTFCKRPGVVVRLATPAGDRLDKQDNLAVLGEFNEFLSLPHDGAFHQFVFI